MKKRPSARLARRAAAAARVVGYMICLAVRYWESWEKRTLPGRAAARTPAYRVPGARREGSLVIRGRTELVRLVQSMRGRMTRGARHARDTCSHTPAMAGLPAPTAWPTKVPSTLPWMKTPVEEVQRSATATALRYRVPSSAR